MKKITVSIEDLPKCSNCGEPVVAIMTLDYLDFTHYNGFYGCNSSGCASGVAACSANILPGALV